MLRHNGGKVCEFQGAISGRVSSFCGVLPFPLRGQRRCPGRSSVVPFASLPIWRVTLTHGEKSEKRGLYRLIVFVIYGR